MSYSIIIPAYNETNSIKKVLESVKLAVPEAEIIVVDDHSSDGTPEAVQKIPEVKLIRHPVNQGAIASVITGIKSASREVVITLDADGQHPVQLISKIAGFVLQDKADIVLGVRSYLPRLGERIIARAAGVSDATTGFRAFKRSHIDLLEGDSAFGGMFIVRAKRKGLCVLEYPITVYPRAAGKSFHSNFKVFLKALCFLFWVWFKKRGRNHAGREI